MLSKRVDCSGPKIRRNKTLSKSSEAFITKSNDDWNYILVVRNECNISMSEVYNRKTSELYNK